MNRKVYIVTDLGPGDGGKGGVVHKLATLRRARSIIKVGGAQGSHGVRNAQGDRFAFSQWGCGTFEGSRTHLSTRFIGNPVGLLNESHALRYNCGIHDPFELLTVDEGVLMATPYHGISSRLKELARGDNPRGTIGTGVGETYRYSLSHPELSFYARDLTRRDVRDRLAAVRAQIQTDLALMLSGDFLAADRELAAEEILNLGDDGFLDYVVDLFTQVANLVHIVPGDYMATEVLVREGNVVVESSHGILTDQRYGFHPHTSAIRTLPQFTRQMLESAGYDGQIVSLAVHRAYTIRHGAGPMPTDDSSMLGSLLPGSHKDESRYQGHVRTGPLDLQLLEYALRVSGSDAYDGIVITWFDQVVQNGEWYICPRYCAGNEDPEYFTADGVPCVRHLQKEADQLAYQAELAQQLFRVTPEIEVRRIPVNASGKQLAELCAATLNERFGVPVRMVSLGPTEQDKFTL